MALEPQQVLDAAEKFVGELHLIRPVHLGLDDIDRAGAAVAKGARPLQVAAGDERAHGGIEETFGNLAAFAVEHGVGVHMMADVAHEQEAAPWQRELVSVRSDVGTVRGESPLDLAPAFLEGRPQGAVDQPKPVAIDEHLVVGVDRRDRILHVHDRSDRRFEHDVGDAGGIVAADAMRVVDLDFHV